MYLEENMKIKKKLLLAATSLSLVLTACGAGSNAPEESDKVKIGVITPQTGPVSIYGQANEQGIKLAVDEINQAGGIDGKEIELSIMDDKGEITEAVTSYNKLVEEDVDLVIGAFTSKPSLAVAETAVNNEIPVITPGGTQEEITEGKANIFRQTFTNSYQGSLLAIFAQDNLNAKTAAILKNSSDDYSTGIAKAFADKAAELGIEIVGEESYGANDTDFKAQLNIIKNANPDILLLPDYYEKLSLIMPQAREVGITSTFIGPDGWAGFLKSLDKSAYDDVDGSYYNDHFAIDSTEPIVKDFVKAYQDAYSEDPISPSALGYDSVYLVKQAIEEAGSLDPKALTDALKTIEFAGVTGSFKFDENNNPQKSSTMIKIEDGQYKFETIVNPR